MTIPIGRFDDRLPPQGKDGDDFQRFVWQALNSRHFDPLVNRRYVRPHFARGNDGAIDHVVEGNGSQIVVECKFFAKTRVGRPRDDWKAIATPLWKNLNAIAVSRLHKIPNIYRPWFRKDVPAVGYWFCTSGSFSHEGDQSDLCDEIKTFFVNLANDHPSLEHLADIDVRVLGWNDFVGALEATPPLRFAGSAACPRGS